MSKIPLPFHVGDISEFAKAVRRQLDAIEGTPGHVEMLNLLVKANGFRNFQHFRAQNEGAHATPSVASPEINYKRIKEVVRHFDSQSRLIRWPKKFSVRMLCLWVMWSRIPARTTLTEFEINELLEQWHMFEDHALLRRELSDRGLVKRTADGRQYTRLEQQADANAVELFKQLRQKASPIMKHQ